MVDRRAFLFGTVAGGLIAAGSLAAGAMAANDSALPFADFPRAKLFSGTRKVFAHWHWFPISVDNKPPAEDYYARGWLTPEGEAGKYAATGGYLRERPLPRPQRPNSDWFLSDMEDDISAAEAIGIDAFQVNLLDVTSGGPFVRNVTSLLDASRAIGARTKVFPCLDCTGVLSKIPPEDLAHALLPWLAHEAVFRSDGGRAYLSAFAAELWSAPRWRALLDSLASLGQTVCFFPVFLDPGQATPAHLALASAASVWMGGSLNALAGTSAFARSLAGEVTWVQPVRTQEFRPKDRWYSEASDSLLFRKCFETAIALDSQALNILTWNDYSEGSELRPSTGIQYGFYDLAAYYIARFKLGYAPPIVRDALYYFHRVQLSGGNNAQKQTFRFTLKGAEPPVDDIELVALLKAPGRIEIETTGGHVWKDANAGMVTLRAPLVPGRPRFRLVRNGHTLIDLASAFEVEAGASFEDYLYRAGSSARPPVGP